MKTMDKTILIFHLTTRNDVPRSDKNNGLLHFVILTEKNIEK